MSKIYTKRGDLGETQLCDGQRISKSSLRIEACGSVDELTSFIGLVLVAIKKQTEFYNLQQQLIRIQYDLNKLNSQLALASDVEIITITLVQNLEQEIDAMHTSLPPLTGFALPGANEVSAHLHVARTVCRRAERILVQLALVEDLDKAAIPYLNRLSDWLFTAACFTE